MSASHPASPALPVGNESRAAAAAAVPLWLTVVVLAVSLGLHWVSLADDSLSKRSEGRYASVSMEMLEGGNWLVPHWMGKPHLTKPPLTYWLEASCLKLMGHNEMAVRFPSAVAGSFAVLCLFLLARHLHGPRAALLAAGILAITPLHVILSRLTLTDGLLGLFWFGTLAAGYLCIREPRTWRWPILLWLCVALSLLTKGPLAWVPVGIIVGWLGVAGRWRELRALRLPVGLVVSAVPLLVWVALVLRFDPEAVRIWYHEMADRVVGKGDHNHPIYYFIPVFLGGLFPATAMLNIPPLNYSWRSAWQSLRRGEDGCLWALAVVVPFVMFSLIKGKLASYLLPLAAPLALLTAVMLDDWIRRDNDHPAADTRPPDVAGTFFICAALATVGAFVGAVYVLGWSYWWLPLPFLVLVAAAGALWFNWKRRPEGRGPALAIVWALAALVWCYAFEMQDWLIEPSNNVHMLEAIRAKAGTDHVTIATFGFDDATLTFYSRQPAPRLGSPDELAEYLAQAPRGLIVLVDPASDSWKKLQDRHPDIAAKLEPLLTWPGWLPGDKCLVLRPRRPA